MENKNLENKTLKEAFPKTIPVLAGYLFLGITYGILAVTSGLPSWVPVLTALFVYTGSMEFLLVSILLSPFNPLSVLATTLMVGARHIFYGLSMLTRYRGTGKAKFYLIYTTSDETFALNCDAKIPEGMDKTKYYFWVSFLDQMYWIAGTAIGAFFGRYITFSTKGLDFVMTAMFVCIFLNQWLRGRDLLIQKYGVKVPCKKLLLAHSGELTGVLISLLCLLVFGSECFIIPSMVLVLAVLAVFRKWIEPAADELVREQKEGEKA